MGREKYHVIKDLKEFKKRIKDRYSISKMILFGSAAYGKMGKNSDLDLVVVSKKFKGKDSLNRSPKLYLEWNLDYPVDFLCYTPEEFKNLSKKITIVREAIKRGIEIK